MTLLEVTRILEKYNTPINKKDVITEFSARHMCIETYPNNSGTFFTETISLDDITEEKLNMIMSKKFHENGTPDSNCVITCSDRHLKIARKVVDEYNEEVAQQKEEYKKLKEEKANRVNKPVDPPYVLVEGFFYVETQGQAEIIRIEWKKFLDAIATCGLITPNGHTNYNEHNI